MRLEKASYNAIKYACINFHYAKRIPVTRAAFSIFNNKNEWCGVICYGSGAGDKVAKHFNMKQGQCCELVRVALNGKQETTSKAVSLSLKILKSQNPLIKLVYSYADVDQNHFGTIYQATNWIYLGQSNVYSAGFIINNKQTHRRSVSSKLKGKKLTLQNIHTYIDKNATEFFSDGKRKYVQIFDKSLLPLYQSLSKPYPKQAQEVNKDKHDAPCIEIGGSNPTLALN